MNSPTMIQPLFPMSPKADASNDTLRAFQAEVERLAQATDAILASSWDDEVQSPPTKATTTTTATKSSVEERKSHSSVSDENDDDDDWSIDADANSPEADDALAKELQLFDALMGKDPSGLSVEISKILHDDEDDNLEIKDDHAPSSASDGTREKNPTPEQKDVSERNYEHISTSSIGSTQEDKSIAESLLITLQEDDSKDPEISPTAVNEGMSQLVLAAKESKNFGIDRTLFVGDGLRVIEADGGNSHDAELIQFTGRIGTESRSVRTRKPLAKPQVLTSDQFEKMKKKGLEGMLVQRNNRKKKVRVMKPYIVPFQDTNETIVFLPRLVSYYEIEIKAPPSMRDSNNKKYDVANSDTEVTAMWDAPCIAVGLAGHDFPMKDTMPGWKQQSFGYHSDDGTAWANQLKSTGYAKKFGVGDVVGCGIDYRAGGTVFYTLNGEFLGHASSLSDKELSMDWYPSIGLDSHDCVQCNFGFDKPFVFDLLKYCQDAPPPPSSRTMAAATEEKGAKPPRSRRFASYILRVVLSSFQTRRKKNQGQITY